MKCWEILMKYMPYFMVLDWNWRQGNAIFFAEEVEFLGHIVSGKRIRMHMKKTDCIWKWIIPANVMQMRSFLGLCSYYRRFIFRCSKIANPVYKLTEKEVHFKQTQGCLNAFQELKSKLVNASVIAHPDFRPSFSLDVEACDQSKGEVIL